MSTTHYAKYSTSPEALSKVCLSFYNAMRERFPDKMIVLAFQGFSGASLASGILVMAGLNDDSNICSLYVRKPDENAHSKMSSEFDRRFRKKNPDDIVVIFVDDFISSGETFIRVRQETWKYFKGKNLVLMLWDCGDYLFAGNYMKEDLGADLLQLFPQLPLIWRFCSQPWSSNDYILREDWNDSAREFRNART